MSSRKSWRIVGALALGLALTATGCGSGDEAADKSDKSATRVFKADNGDITIPTDPKRVVATGYAVPVLIEADAALVGISSWKRGIPMMTDEDRATYEKLEKIAGETAAETNYEAVAAVKPDLIVIGVPAPVLADVDIKRLETIAPVVAIGPTLPDAWREQSRQQSDAAGRLDNFETEQEGLRGQGQAGLRQVQGRPEGPEVRAPRRLRRGRGRRVPPRVRRLLGHQRRRRPRRAVLRRGEEEGRRQRGRQRVPLHRGTPRQLLRGRRHHLHRAGRRHPRGVRQVRPGHRAVEEPAGGQGRQGHPGALHRSGDLHLGPQDHRRPRQGARTPAGE